MKSFLPFPIESSLINKELQQQQYRQEIFLRLNLNRRKFWNKRSQSQMKRSKNFNKKLKNTVN